MALQIVRPWRKVEAAVKNAAQERDREPVAGAIPPAARAGELVRLGIIGQVNAKQILAERTQQLPQRQRRRLHGDIQQWLRDQAGE